jgi:hypothetical protein
MKLSRQSQQACKFYRTAFAVLISDLSGNRWEDKIEGSVAEFV